MSQEAKTKIYWPSPQDYSEAVQTPRLSFDNEELAGATVACNKLGLPICMSGNFASVFCFTGGGRKIAVRCFLHTITDEGERYAAIAKAMTEQDLTCTVPFQYLEKGVRVNGSWYPILKMDWVPGQSLHKFVESILDNPMALNLLAGYFKQSLVDLSKAGIAHGDLQHDNILVSKSELRLVDYDGMYVAALAGSQAKELGHPNYQHPDRTSTHYGPYLDNFSAWLIFSSLKILSVDPSFYRRFDGGADCLLFRRSDLSDPNHSQLFRTLEAHDEQEVRWFAFAMRRFVSMGLEEVPALKVPLQEIVDNVIILPTQTSRKQSEGKSVSEKTETGEKNEISPINHPKPSWIAGITQSGIGPWPVLVPPSGKLQAAMVKPIQPPVKPPAVRPKKVALSGFQKSSAPKQPISFKPVALDTKQTPQKTIEDLLSPGEFICWYTAPQRWRQTKYWLSLAYAIPVALGLCFLLGLQIVVLLICLGIMLFSLSERKDSQAAFVTDRRLVLCDRRWGGLVVTSVELACIEHAFYSSLDRAVHVRARTRWIGSETRRVRIQCLSKNDGDILLNLLSPPPHP